MARGQAHSCRTVRVGRRRGAPIPGVARAHTRPCGGAAGAGQGESAGSFAVLTVPARAALLAGRVTGPQGGLNQVVDGRQEGAFKHL